MNDIQLRFVNNSQETNNPDIGVFCSSAAQGDTVIVWTLIRNCGIGDYHPFVYSADTEVSASDSDGNYTPRLASAPGDTFAMQPTASGNELLFTGNQSGSQEIVVTNDLPDGPITVYMYRSGRAFAGKPNIVPQSRALFEFRPAIYIAEVTTVLQEGILPTAVVAQLPTEINLLGISSADIVMTGGGTRPLEYSLANVVMA